MWIRSAYWTGKPVAGKEGEFRSAVDQELVPGLKALPGVTDALSLWPKRLEDQPPTIGCQVIVYFDSEADIDRMLDSPERHALRARVREIAAMFDGAISHIDFEVG